MKNENQQINLHVKEGQNEVIILHGEAAPAEPFRKSVKVSGTLDVPRIHLMNPPKWLTNKLSPENIKEENRDSPMQWSHVEVNRESGSIKYIEDAGSLWESTFTGTLSVDPRFEKFGINSGKSYTTLELSNFIKMNRTFFETKDKAMLLVSDLRKFKAKVDKDVENQADDRGNRRILLAQAVESNIPESFKIYIPVFKGYPAQILEIEISIDPGDLSCSLISPEAADYIEETKDALIDVELEEIAELHPTLRIFEV